MAPNTGENVFSDLEGTFDLSSFRNPKDLLTIPSIAPKNRTELRLEQGDSQNVFSTNYIEKTLIQDGLRRSMRGNLRKHPNAHDQDVSFWEWPQRPEQISSDTKEVVMESKEEILSKILQEEEIRLSLNGDKIVTSLKEDAKRRNEDRLYHYEIKGCSDSDDYWQWYADDETENREVFSMMNVTKKLLEDSIKRQSHKNEVRRVSNEDSGEYWGWDEDAHDEEFKVDEDLNKLSKAELLKKIVEEENVRLSLTGHAIQKNLVDASKRTASQTNVNYVTAIHSHNADGYWNF